MPGHQILEPLLPTQSGRNSRSLRLCWSRSGLSDFWGHLCPAHSQLWVYPNASFYFPKAVVSKLASTPPPLSHARSVGVLASVRKRSPPGKCSLHLSHLPLWTLLPPPRPTPPPGPGPHPLPVSPGPPLPSHIFSLVPAHWLFFAQPKRILKSLALKRVSSASPQPPASMESP